MIERTLFKKNITFFASPFAASWKRKWCPITPNGSGTASSPATCGLKAGEAGLLCCTVPEEYGGLGLDYLFDVVVFEELWRVGASGPGFLIHTDLVATYILSFGTEEQKRHWLPRMVKGEAIGSLGMTEPHAGSDLKAIRTRATRGRR